MAHAFIDNDVLYKMAAYGLLLDWLQKNPLEIDRFQVLVAAKFMVQKKLQKKPPSRGAVVAIEEFAAAFAQVAAIEPSEAELRLAAQFEFAAQQADVELDAGESLLCAALLCRGADYIFTGDKRAIVALQQLLIENAVPPDLGKRFVCLEQIFAWLVQNFQADQVRSAVCGERKVDQALANCFSCGSATANVESWMEGLGSYIGSLQSKAPDMLTAWP